MRLLKSKIESLLFLSGEPLSTRQLQKQIGVPANEILDALNSLRRDYEDRGVKLIEKDDEWQMATSPENAELLKELVKSEFAENLSKASLETVSIIAYKGPLTRAKIEFIRGVNSSYSLRSLLLRGLIERIDNPVDSRSYLYRISFDFLKYLGLTRREDLPGWDELSSAKLPATESKSLTSEEVTIE